MANEFRNELDIELPTPNGDKIVYTLRPTFAALVEIEAETKKSIIELAIDGANKRLPLTSVRAIITAGIKASGAGVKPNLDYALEQIGAVAATEVACVALAKACEGGSALKKSLTPAESSQSTSSRGKTTWVSRLKNFIGRLMCSGRQRSAS